MQGQSLLCALAGDSPLQGLCLWRGRGSLLHGRGWQLWLWLSGSAAAWLLHARRTAVGLWGAAWWGLTVYQRLRECRAAAADWQERPAVLRVCQQAQMW